MKLDDQALARALRQLASWKLDAGKLHRKFEFADFRAAFAFMTRCALAAEASNHHPEWRNVWNKVDVWLTTHDANGITEKDTALAAEFDAAATAEGAKR